MVVSMFKEKDGRTKPRVGRSFYGSTESQHDRKYGGGMEFIRAMQRAEREWEKEAPKPPDRVVGSFGIIDDKKREHIINWRVNGYRKDLDKVVHPEPAGLGDYSNSLLDSMFAGWK